MSVLTVASKGHRSNVYTVGIITALAFELSAAIVMLDEEQEKLPGDEFDPTIYTLGRIGAHGVVIACLPSGQTGLSSATAVATRMLHKFASIKIGFMVGIGGGVPSSEADIRLGDVVVSVPEFGHGGVVQYDMGKSEIGHFRRTGHLNLPPNSLLNVVQQARADYELGRSTFETHMARFSEHIKPQVRRRFTRGSAGSDLLFTSTYNHVGGPTCKDCRPDMLVDRTPRENEDCAVEVHFGTIASGNRVMKDARERDKIAQALGGRVLCFEMEAAGLMNDFPCLVIRGISDYSDSISRIIGNATLPQMLLHIPRSCFYQYRQQRSQILNQYNLPSAPPG